MKNKIVIVSGFYPRVKGGAEYQMKIIAEELKKNFEIVFIYLGDVPDQRVSETTCEYIDGFKVYSVQTVSKYDRFILQYFYSRRLKKILDIERPDIVYQRVLKFMSFYLSLFQKSIGYTHFIHIADLYSLSFNSGVKDKIKLLFFQSTLKNNPKFVVQTNEQKQILNKLGVNPVLQVYNMHPIIDFDLESIFTNKKNNKVKHIVWVANIKPIKQIEVLLEVAKKFEENKSIVFDVIGSVQDINYVGPILHKMEKLSNINHFKDKDNQFVNKYLINKASLVINTSKNEGFSNVFIQSWLAGVPVLSLNSNPDGLFTKYSVLGYFCDNSIKKFQDYIIRFEQKDILIQEVDQIQKIATELFAVDRSIVKLKKIIDTYSR